MNLDESMGSSKKVLVIRVANENSEKIIRSFLIGLSVLTYCEAMKITAHTVVGWLILSVSLTLIHTIL